LEGEGGSEGRREGGRVGIDLLFMFSLLCFMYVFFFSQLLFLAQLDYSHTLFLFLPTTTEPVIDLEQDFAGMRVAKLRSLLQEQGEECVGCVEKDDYVRKIKEVGERRRRK